VHLVWRIGLGIACAALAIGLFRAWGPVNADEPKAAPPPATTTQPAPTTTEGQNSGPLEAEIELTAEGIAEPVSLSVGAGQPITLIVTAPFLAHLALFGDDEAGGFLEPGTTTLKFTVEKPGTYPLQVHTDAPEPLEIGDLVVLPAS
jgi:hypothetical protein